MSYVHCTNPECSEYQVPKEDMTGAAVEEIYCGACGRQEVIESQGEK